MFYSFNNHNCIFSTTKDIMVRAELASLICSLCPTNKTHQEFAINLLRDLIKQYRAVQLETITPGTITNSLEHRKKHRLLQIVFLLETFLVQVFRHFLTLVWINSFISKANKKKENLHAKEILYFNASDIIQQ